VGVELGARSIAFPAISTGAYGYPKDRAAAVAVATVRADASPGLSITLVAHDADTFDLYRALLADS
jgi:O-acetyl-ADP-ribose deacetylase (regulator of RNase III)